MKDRHNGVVETEEMDHDNMDEIDMNGSSTLVISESALSINGDGDDDESQHELSIDTEEPEEAAPIKPSIRVVKGLTRDNNDNQHPSVLGGILAAQLTAGTKRKSTGGVVTNGLSPVKKVRPSSADNDQEILSLEKEVRALQWLARRKEREWDQVISLMKQKEERLMKAQRTKVMIQAEADHLLTKYKPSPAVNSTNTTLLLPTQPVIVPQQQVMLLPTTASNNTTTVRQIQPRPATTTTAAVKTVSTTAVNSSSRNSPVKSPVTSGQDQDLKISSAVEKATQNLQRAAAGGNTGGGREETKKMTPNCQGCGLKKSEFVCAGCSNRWYCSRECQVDKNIFIMMNLYFTFPCSRWRIGMNTLTSAPARPVETKNYFCNHLHLNPKLLLL